MVVVLGRGELTHAGQVHQLAPMVNAHLPKGTVRAMEASSLADPPTVPLGMTPGRS